MSELVERFLSDVLPSLSVPTIVAAVAIQFLFKLIDRRLRHTLKWTVGHLAPCKRAKLLKSMPECIRSRIILEDQRLDRLAKFVFFLRHSGDNGLREDDIVTPLTWTAPGRIYAAWVEDKDTRSENETPPELDACGGRLKIRWGLFNPGRTIVIGALCEYGTQLHRGTISGQIKDVHRIRSFRGYFGGSIVRYNLYRWAKMILAAPLVYGIIFLVLQLQRL